jgi:hypothetical protein
LKKGERIGVFLFFVNDEAREEDEGGEEKEELVIGVVDDAGKKC